MNRMPHAKLVAVMALIHTRMPQSITLEQMATAAGFSPSRFLVLFRNTTGLSPHQFVLRERLEKARSLLSETDLPLSVIANECGFADQSHLIRRFKRHTGHTPRQFRSQPQCGTRLSVSGKYDGQRTPSAVHTDAVN